MKLNRITSRKNSIITSSLSLFDKKGRQASSLFITEGLKIYLEAAKEGIYPEKVFLREGSEKLISFFESEKSEAEFYELSQGAYEKLDRDRSPDGLILVYSMPPKVKKAEKLDTQLILEGIQDPGNLGTVIRTAAAFGIDRIIVTGCADIWSSKTVRSSMGAVFRIPILECDSIELAVNAVKENNSKIYGATLSETSKNIKEVSFSSPVAVMIGNEGHGLSNEAVSLCDENVIIPMNDAESLNAAVAAAVFMWEMKRG